jgi:hypothetical protein
MGNYVRGSYHGSHPRWRNGFNEEGNYVGIEFEVESSNYREVLRLLPDFPAEISPLTECDGSLGSNGVEIIFPPIALSRLKRSDCSFHRSISAIKEVVRHHEGTGMHMNVNTRGWLNDATAVFCAVVHHLPEEHLRNLGGRRPTEYCAQMRGREFQSYRRGCVGHFAADNKPNRIEMRFPMSTCDKDRIDGLVDFIERLSVFATTKTDFAVKKVTQLKTPQSAENWWDEPISAKYEELVGAFYSFLNRTKKGKKVLDILHTDVQEAPDVPDYDDGYSGDDDYDDDDDDY